MPPDQSPAAKNAPAKPDRKFRVIKGQVGPWRNLPGQNTFAESEFVRLHPAPEKGPDREGYHDALLGRLAVLGVVSQLPPDAVADPTPAGPESGIGAAAGTIAAAAKAVVDQRAAQAASVTAVTPDASPAPAHPVPPIQQGVTGTK